MIIVCITPLKHLEGLYKKLTTFGKVYYEPEINYKNLKKILNKNKKIDTIFCNPNKQNYKIDLSLLKNSGVKLINTASTGLNHIDMAACKKLNIQVISLKDDRKLLKKLPSTSEVAFCLMINLLKNFDKSFKSVQKFNWNYEPFIGRELASLTVGIIGYGRLGKFMSKFCTGFDMKIKIYDPFVKAKKFSNTSLLNIFKSCDIISLHVHADKFTKYMINYKLLSSAKKKPIIINTSRGEIVLEKDIIRALKKNIISGYGCDVVEHEFGNLKISPIINNIINYNIIVTPHIGGMSIEGQKRAWIHAIEKFENKKLLNLSK